MAKNYEICLSYLDFEDTEFTEEQQEEIRSRYDMYFILSETEYQMKYIAKMLLKGDSDRDIWRYLGLRLRHVNQHIPRPPHINYMLKLPKCADITSIFKDYFKDELKALDEVCKKSPYYRAYPPVSAIKEQSSDYNDYALLPEEEKKNRKLSYYPDTPEVIEAKRQKLNEQIARTRRSFGVDDNIEEVPIITNVVVDKDAIRAAKKETRIDSMRHHLDSFTSDIHHSRKSIIIDLINRDRINIYLIDILMNEKLDQEVVEVLYNTLISRKVTYDFISMIATPGLSVGVVKEIIEIISTSVAGNYESIRKCIDICIKYKIKSTGMSNNEDIIKIKIADTIYGDNKISKDNHKYLIDLISNINNYSINDIQNARSICSKYPDISIPDALVLYRLAKKYSSQSTRPYILANTVVAHVNGLSIDIIEYCLKHCDNRSSKMWVLRNMAEHGLDMDNIDIEHIEFNENIDKLITNLHENKFPIEIMLEWFEGLVNEYGPSHRYYSLADLSNYMDIFIKKMNNDITKFITDNNIPTHLMIGETLKYIHIGHYLGFSRDEINSYITTENYYTGTKYIICTDAFNTINRIAAKRKIKYVIKPNAAIYTY